MAEILKQVTGSDKDLIDAIRDGDVERPELMAWNTWQKWRNKPGGSRPTTARDGGRTSNQLEVTIWRAVMRDLYGEQWERDLERLRVFDEIAWVVEAAIKEPYKLWKDKEAQWTFIKFDLKKLRAAERGRAAKRGRHRGREEEGDSEKEHTGPLTHSLSRARALSHLLF